MPPLSAAAAALPWSPLSRCCAGPCVVCSVTSCRWPGGGGRGRGGPDTLAPPPPDTGAPPRPRSLSGQVTGQVQVHHYYQMMNTQYSEKAPTTSFSYMFRAKFGCRIKLVAPSIKTSLSMPAPTSALCLAAVAVLCGESDSFTGVVIVRSQEYISQSSTVSGWQCLGEMKEPSPQIVFQLLLHSTPPWVHCQWWPRY